MIKVEFYLSRAGGQWYWRLVARNGRTIADGAEGYSRKASVERAFYRMFHQLRQEGVDVKT